MILLTDDDVLDGPRGAQPQATTTQSFTRPPRSWTRKFAGLLLVLMRAAPHANPDEVIGVRYKLEATRAALPSR
jgi:hypothetical protein